MLGKARKGAKPRRRAERQQGITEHKAGDHAGSPLRYNGRSGKRWSGKEGRNTRGEIGEKRRRELQEIHGR